MKRLYPLTLALLLLAHFPLPAARAQQTVFVPDCSGANDTAQFQAAVSAIGSNVGTIRLPYKAGTRCAVNNLTVPASVTLDFSDGALKVNTGQTLTVVGPVNAPRGRQIFYNALSGQGTVSFAGNRAVTEMVPQWFGAVAGDNADDTAAIRAAITAFETRCADELFPDYATGCGRFLFPAGDYDVGAGVTSGSIFTFTKPFAVVGERGARLLYPATASTSVDAITFKPRAPPPGGFNIISRYAIENVGIYPKSPFSGQALRYGVLLDFSNGGASQNAEVRQFRMTGCFIQTSAQAFATSNPNNDPSGGVFASQVDNNYLWNGFKLDRAGDTIVIGPNNLITGPYSATAVPSEVNLVSGSTGPFVYKNNITQCGGLWWRSSYGGTLEDNIIELVGGANCLGHNGAAVDLDGGGASFLQDTLVRHNTINSQLGTTVDAVRVNNARYVTVEQNSYILPAGKRVVYATASAVHLTVDPEGESSYGASGLNYIGDAGTDWRYNLKSKNEAAGGAAQNLGNLRLSGDAYAANYFSEGVLSFTGKTFAHLGSATAGQFVWCRDCAVVSAAPHTCTGGGSGAWAFRSAGGTWKCPF